MAVLRFRRLSALPQAVALYIGRTSIDLNQTEPVRAPIRAGNLCSRRTTRVTKRRSEDVSTARAVVRGADPASIALAGTGTAALHAMKKGARRSGPQFSRGCVTLIGVRRRGGVVRTACQGGALTFCAPVDRIVGPGRGRGVAVAVEIRLNVGVRDHAACCVIAELKIAADGVTRLGIKLRYAPKCVPDEPCAGRGRACRGTPWAPVGRAAVRQELVSGLAGRGRCQTGTGCGLRNYGLRCPGDRLGQLDSALTVRLDFAQRHVGEGQ